MKLLNKHPVDLRGDQCEQITIDVTSNYQGEQAYNYIPRQSFVDSQCNMLRGVTLPALFVRFLLIASLLIYAVSTRAQNPAPPTAAEQQQIQKCHDETTKTDSLVAQSIETRTTAVA